MVQLTLLVLITVMWLSLPPFIIIHHCLWAYCCRPFLFLSLRSVHPSRSSFIRQRFGRSVHPSSLPEPIRCIPPSLSRSVSPPHSVSSDSSLIFFSSVLSIVQ